MATRYGYEILCWLVARGWKAASLRTEEDYIGDQQVIEPVTGKEITVYEAAKKQREKSGEYPDFLLDG